MMAVRLSAARTNCDYIDYIDGGGNDDDDDTCYYNSFISFFLKI